MRVKCATGSFKTAEMTDDLVWKSQALKNFFIADEDESKYLKEIRYNLHKEIGHIYIRHDDIAIASALGKRYGNGQSEIYVPIWRKNIGIGNLLWGGHWWYSKDQVFRVENAFGAECGVYAKGLCGKVCCLRREELEAGCAEYSLDLSKATLEDSKLARRLTLLNNVEAVHGYVRDKRISIGLNLERELSEAYLLSRAAIELHEDITSNCSIIDWAGITSAKDEKKRCTLCLNADMVSRTTFYGLNIVFNKACRLHECQFFDCNIEFKEDIQGDFLKATYCNIKANKQYRLYFWWVGNTSFERNMVR